MSGYWIDGPQVKTAAKSYTDLGNRMQEVLQALVDGIGAEGHCQGGDQYGEAFDKNYSDPKINALEFFPQMRDGLKDMAAGLEEMADTTARGEDANDKKFQR
ncbi:hypothetical protein ACQP00_40835 [Dactylosporangium sp. CS-047395]|uniref:hypothetical protein n=1 Tax=Dactylosporangium sp. CS-047395 TaxID=3239936 RepID=UPI003D8CAD37